MRGIGRFGDDYAKRYFNAIPLLGYWDIYKNCFANKMEERGYVIHASEWENGWDTYSAEYNGQDVKDNDVDFNTTVFDGTDFVLVGKWQANDIGQYGTPNLDLIRLTQDGVAFPITTLYSNVTYVEIEPEGNIEITCTGWLGTVSTTVNIEFQDQTIENTTPVIEGRPQLTEFPLDNIDDMRMDILEAVRDSTAFEIVNTTAAPYGLGLGWNGTNPWDAGETNYYKTASQEGLGVKTYQSDLFNNWISTEWIDGTNGINEVTAVSTAGNEFTIDSLNLANKVYNMLNRIAISGGSYDDWLDAVYTHERSKSCENPMYMVLHLNYLFQTLLYLLPLLEYPFSCYLYYLVEILLIAVFLLLLLLYYLLFDLHTLYLLLHLLHFANLYMLLLYFLLVFHLLLLHFQIMLLLVLIDYLLLILFHLSLAPHTLPHHLLAIFLLLLIEIH